MRLLTIPFSHFCEKARWGLDLLGKPYVEEPHLPFFHIAANRRAGANRTVPALVVDGGRVIGDSTDILRFCDEALPPARRLYPADVAAEALALEEQFDDVVGAHARRIGYFYGLPDRRFILALSGAAPRFEKAALSAAFPLARWYLRRAFRVNAEGVARSEAKVMELFATLDARLADGRAYLCGSQFSAADLTLAALGSILVDPAEHPGRVPDAPAASFPMRDRFRATRAGAHILKMYREHRAPAANG